MNFEGRDFYLFCYFSSVEATFQDGPQLYSHIDRAGFKQQIGHCRNYRVSLPKKDHKKHLGNKLSGLSQALDDCWPGQQHLFFNLMTPRLRRN